MAESSSNSNNNNQAGSSTSTFSASTTFDINRNMSDSQFRQTWTQISTAANATFASPTPQPAHSKTYLKNLHTWSTTTTPPPKNAGQRSTRTRGTRATAVAPPPVYTPPAVPAPVAAPIYQPAVPLPPALPPNPPRPPLPTAPQALQSTYASRLRTGTTLLMQPILTNPSASSTRAATRRGGVINYADPGSGDDLPDAGALDSDDSDFVASGGTRTSVRQSRSRGAMAAGMGVFNPSTGVTTAVARPPVQQGPAAEKAELDQSYLGMEPPARFIKAKPMAPTVHEYPPPDVLETQAQKRSSLVPIRVEFETDTHRIRDCFVWNINETLVKPEAFARVFCYDLDLPMTPWAETVANQIKAQLEEYEGVAGLELGQDGAMSEEGCGQVEIPECRVILSIDVQIANHHLMDHIEWDLLSPLTPEAFSMTLCKEVGLCGEAVPVVAHAIHEELMKHKKDAIEWGVIGGEGDEGGAMDRERRDRSGFGLVKDKTGLGLGWGRAPKDGRGPKRLRSVWRDWTEAEDFCTKVEVMSAEEVEKREIERERATRRLRRETSKFQRRRR